MMYNEILTSKYQETNSSMFSLSQKYSMLANLKWSNVFSCFYVVLLDGIMLNSSSLSKSRYP